MSVDDCFETGSIAKLVGSQRHITCMYLLVSAIPRPIKSKNIQKHELQEFVLYLSLKNENNALFLFFVNMEAMYE